MRDLARRGRRLGLFCVVAASVCALGCVSAQAQTIHTEVAHRTKVQPTGGAPILSDPDCLEVGQHSKTIGAACFRPKNKAWYVIVTNNKHYDIEVHAIGNWRSDGSSTTSFLCADRTGDNGGWTTCDHWASITPKNHSFAWTLDAYKGNHLVATSAQGLTTT